MTQTPTDDQPARSDEPGRAHIPADVEEVEVAEDVVEDDDDDDDDDDDEETDAG